MDLAAWHADRRVVIVGKAESGDRDQHELRPELVGIGAAVKHVQRRDEAARVARREVHARAAVALRRNESVADRVHVGAVDNEPKRACPCGDAKHLDRHRADQRAVHLRDERDTAQDPP